MDVLLNQRTMKTGDLVSKKSGYKYIGYIVADFKKTTGERRLVVECINTGMLHVFNESNLEPTKEGLHRNQEQGNEEMFFVEIEGTHYILPDSVYDDFFNDYYSSKITAKEFDKKYSKYWAEEVLKKNKLYLKPKK